MTYTLLSDAQLSRLRTLFADAVDLSPAEREAFLLDSTSGDPLLRRQLSSLLEAHDSSASWFENFQRDVIVPALDSLDAIDDDAKTGQQVSHYELLEKIGGGGMGIVFKARDTRLGRLAALKFLPRHHASNAALRDRLVIEAKAASRLDHPNIGTVYEIGEAGNGRQFIAMAWYDGETLKSRIARGQLSPQEVAHVGIEIASALAAAHKAGIVHRDVKPANVLLTSSGTAKLVDFGIATLASENHDYRDAMAGTLAYMSPEQTLGKPVDARTDIWSLGATLYEALTGQRPFNATNDKALVAAIRSDDPPLDGLGDDLHQVLRRCLQKDADRRYATATEVERDLARWSQSLEHGESKGKKPVKYLRPVLAAGLLFIATLGAWTYSRTSESNRRDELMRSPLQLAVISAGEPDPATETIGDAISADLREELSRIPLISVSHSTPSRFIVRTEVIAQTPLTVRLEMSGATKGDGHSRTYRADSAGSEDLVRSMARDIASWTRLPLSREQSRALNVPRTQNRESYRLYLSGRAAELAAAPALATSVIDAEKIRSAQGFYARARALDPLFGSVRAHLATTHIASATTFDTTHTRLEQARLEAETALRINVTDPEASSALASYWTLMGNRQKAIEQLELSLKATPNATSLLIPLAEQYRASGRLDDAIEIARTALKVDPLNPNALWVFSTTSGRVRRYAESFIAHSRYLTVRPHDYEVRLIRGQAYLRWKGTADTLLNESEKIPADWDRRGMATYARYTALRVMRRHRDALSVLEKSKAGLSTDGLVYQPLSLMRAEIYHDMHDEKKAMLFYEKARAELSDSASAHPQNANILVSLGLAYAGLGRNSDAIATVQRAIDMAPLTKQTPVATSILGSAVEVYARTGAIDRAFESIELLMTMPAGREMSIAFLQAWPAFDPLRKDPRYSAIIRRFS